ncbi:MBL fold metallo-hydrolase [Microvirga subterranea]|uniref:Glyoxylase-like metal-dependent hydrolase (Beta-lactamase superfamily II) n=1 Tax=Microvirga subterranea TaxID=186651 RepID=A0A370HA29_9HYPH|nr:MBL fold metallo-hydrolase [Microvirga subterranea]RDI53803.1 glyoxylase-like metal-dependent hydrolase (beta-lactamase superfamily II) [Microvirga subterranea]
MAQMEPDKGDEDRAVYDRAIPVGPNILRVTANNPGTFTSWGTNTYIVGTGTLAIIDPGPDDAGHLRLLLSLIGDRPVSHIFVTHTHRDHSALAAGLKAATGARTAAQGPQPPPKPIGGPSDKIIESGTDPTFIPDLILLDGDVVRGDGWSLEAIHTPGHAANHLSLGLVGTGALFSGDHVMGWSTTIVAPPDGSMVAYIASLDKLLDRNDILYLPGHGGLVTQPLDRVRTLLAHREMREAMVLARVRGGDRTVPDLVHAIYSSTNPALHGAAALTVFAHLERLIERGLVKATGQATMDGLFEPA